MKKKSPINNTKHRIKACRICGNKKLKDILSLGKLHISDFIDADADSPATKYPLDLIICDRKSGGCGLVQIREAVSPEAMYRNYWYLSGVNKTMVDELTDIARITEKIVKLENGDVVVDIGSNDGTLLRSYTTRKILRVGFEPAKNLMKHAREGASHIFSDFFSAALFKKKFKSKKVKIVTAIAMFYDLNDPNGFVSDVASILDERGIFVIQLTDLPSMLVLRAFDNICHEHIEYYSLDVLKHLLARHGLEVFDLDSNDVNGGSLRVYVRHKGSSIGDERFGKDLRLLGRVSLEDTLGMNKESTYKQFAKEILSIKEKLVQFIEKERALGKTVYVYGASTKGNTLLQFFNLGNKQIEAAAERNPIKWGKKTVGTHIPIVSEEDARKNKPDYFLLLPWHFLHEFIDRERDFILAGGKFIVPLPEFKIIGAKDLGLKLNKKKKMKSKIKYNK